MTPTLNMVLVYARDQQKTADFYAKFFGFQQISNPDNVAISSRPFRQR